jgi:hypothetical protein
VGRAGRATALVRSGLARSFCPFDRVGAQRLALLAYPPVANGGLDAGGA